MAAPWEMFKDETGPAQAAGPWSKFSDEVGTPEASADAPAQPGQTLMPEPILSGFLGAPDYKAQAHADKVMGRAVLKGAATGAGGVPALVSDAVSNIGYGAKKLANKAGLAEAPDPRNYYGDNPGDSYFPALSALKAGVDKGLDAAGLDRAQTPGERMVSAGFEGAASGVGGFLAGKVAQAGGGAAAGLASQPAQVAAASGAAAGVAGEGAAMAGETEAGRKFLPEWAPTAVGMATGALTGGALGRAASRAANARLGPAPTAEELTTRRDAGYANFRNSGVEVQPDSYRRMTDGIRQGLDDAGIFRDLDPGPEASRLLGYLDASTPGGAPVTMSRLEGVRQAINRSSQSTDPTTARMATIMRREYDDFLYNRAQPTDFIEPTPGAARTALESAREARQLHGRVKKLEYLENGIEAATDRAGSTGSGANGQNASRQDLRAMIKPGSPLSRRVGFNTEETAQARSIVRGGSGENLLRGIGKLGPTGAVSAIPSALAVGAAGPMGLALPAAGYLAKAASERIQRGKIDRLSDTIRRGYALPEVSGMPGSAQGALSGYLATQSKKPGRGRYR